MNFKIYISTFNRCVASLYRKAMSIVYARQYRALYAGLGLKWGDNKLLKEWRKKWSRIGSAHPIYFKLFSQYIGPDMNIVPEDISHNIIEPILNPPTLRDYFQDKNMFDKLVTGNIFPRTLLRRIRGFFYDADYKKVECNSTEDLLCYFSGYNKLIAKVAVDSCSGNGVRMLYKYNGRWIDKDSGEEIDFVELNHTMGADYLIQECLAQSEFMGQFCETSVNTIRLFVYKSVRTDEPHAITAVMRIGKSGSYKDNAHQGGVVVGIKQDGTLNPFITDQYGRKYTDHNGINFSNRHFVLPDWDEVKRFGEDVVRHIPYHRCFNLDIMIDEHDTPRLIEVNLRSMSVWLYQFNTCSCYGEYTDEVIDYCKRNLKNLKNEYLLL